MEATTARKVNLLCTRSYVLLEMSQILDIDNFDRSKISFVKTGHRVQILHDGREFLLQSPKLHTPGIREIGSICFKMANDTLNKDEVRWVDLLYAIKAATKNFLHSNYPEIIFIPSDFFLRQGSTRQEMYVLLGKSEIYRADSNGQLNPTNIKENLDSKSCGLASCLFSTRIIVSRVCVCAVHSSERLILYPKTD